jgi:hypothetical protein
VSKSLAALKRAIEGSATAGAQTRLLDLSELQLAVGTGAIAREQRVSLITGDLTVLVVRRPVSSLWRQVGPVAARKRTLSQRDTKRLRLRRQRRRRRRAVASPYRQSTNFDAK